MIDKVVVKIGIVIPAFNPLVEYELARMIPPDVSFHVARTKPAVDIRTTTITPDHMRSMASEVLDAVKLLNHVKPDVIAYAFGMGASSLGVEGERKLVTEMEKESGVPCLTTASAQIEACQVLGVRNLSVLSGHTKERTESSIDFLEKSGVHVLNTSYISEEEVKSKGGLFDYPQQLWLERASETLDRGADGVFIAGGAYRSLDILEEFERKTGKTLITNPPPTLWAALRKVKYGKPIESCGKLLRDHLK
jgi:maleate isomerase